MKIRNMCINHFGNLPLMKCNYIRSSFELLRYLQFIHSQLRLLSFLYYHFLILYLKHYITILNRTQSMGDNYQVFSPSISCITSITDFSVSLLREDVASSSIIYTLFCQEQRHDLLVYSLSS
jgi:hypothetical protein